MPKGMDKWNRWVENHDFLLVFLSFSFIEKASEGFKSSFWTAEGDRVAFRAAEQGLAAEDGQGGPHRSCYGHGSEPDRRALDAFQTGSRFTFGVDVVAATCGGSFMAMAASFETIQTELLYGGASSVIVPGVRTSDLVAFRCLKCLGARSADHGCLRPDEHGRGSDPLPGK